MRAASWGGGAVVWSSEGDENRSRPGLKSSQQELGKLTLIVRKVKHIYGNTMSSGGVKITLITIRLFGLNNIESLGHADSS